MHCKLFKFNFQLATQTPGPLVGNTVSNTEPSTGLELVPLHSTKTEQNEIPSVTAYSNSRQVTFLPPKDPEGNPIFIRKHKDNSTILDAVTGHPISKL